jgi:hypothetical protein
MIKGLFPVPLPAAIVVKILKAAARRVMALHYSGCVRVYVPVSVGPLVRKGYYRKGYYTTCVVCSKDRCDWVCIMTGQLMHTACWVTSYERLIYEPL